MPNLVHSLEFIVGSKNKKSTNDELITNNSFGYTLVELLVVITIMGVLSVGSVVYYKSLTSDKAILKAVDSIQSLLRTAQSNATSGFACGAAQGASTWSVKFENETTLKLSCNPANEPILVRTLTLENNTQIDSITGSRCTSPDWPVNVFYAPLNGSVAFKNGVTDLDNCLTSNTTLTVTLKNVNDSIPCNEPSNSCKSFIISRGGAINAQ